MLKTISPLISPELLKVLAEMGHGDEIIFSDSEDMLNDGICFSRHLLQCARSLAKTNRNIHYFIYAPS